MSVSKWDYIPKKCDGDYCPGSCDNCPKCGGDMKESPHWINHTEYGVTTYITDKDVECSECGHKQPKLFDMKFCPHCGADMRGEKK